MAVRAQVGRLSNAGVSRRRRNPTAKPRREADEPILPGAHRPTGRYATRTLRRRRRDRDRRVGGLDFETLLLRIHPAASRVKLLSARAPASFVAWDLLALGDDDLRDAALAVRRERLEHVLAGAAPPVHLSPATRDPALAADWFRRFEGAGLDGVMAKRLEAPYRAGERTMIKVKHERTADCVVAGFRWHKKGAGTMIGSLLLGLYDDEHTLHHVGVAAAFTATVRKQLVIDLTPLRADALEDHPWRDWAVAQEEASAKGQRRT